ncbi:MAG TPA: polysaccharide deacetylase family protein [Candidatus Hydrogenedentes bacterium]|jgi:peptidoglycan/xylan/chitin deacetylase (PgdA/CDA1 family)|nr:polysaccharide deacetylase family protein [Candidatus Hydrogenedentota bacterium]HPJ99546.1 polysaccharide deacetylase family protein [Candidatus Hydrogenedentota bacterium]
MPASRWIVFPLLLCAVFLCTRAVCADSSALPAADSASAPPPGVKTVYLTFDDGPSELTPALLDVLKQHEAAATFFVCGNVTEFGNRMYNRILDEGHALGNHTFSHQYRTVYKSADAFEKNVARLDDLIFRFTGTRPRLLRFPAGSNNRITRGPDGKSITHELVDRMAKLGYRHVDWNVDSLDHGVNASSSEAIAKTVIEGVLKRDQAIVLMHDSYTHAATVEAVPVIIRELRSKGYIFSPLSETSYTVQFLKSQPANGP